MFNGNFKEASENVAYLTEDDPASFDLLADWANHPMTSKSPRSIRELTTTKLKDGKEVASWDPVGFYSLAEKYCLPELQDIIMDALIQHHKVQNELPSVGFVVRAYKHTSTGSLLTKYCAEGIFFVMERVALDARWPTEDVAHLFQELPTFASEYISVQRKRGDLRPWTPRIQGMLLHVTSILMVLVSPVLETPRRGKIRRVRRGVEGNDTLLGM